jgi:Methylamine utilisation protein MauE
MTAVATLLAALLALVLLVAGVAKLQRTAATANTLLEFGLPKTVASSLARVLPVLEIGLAVALFLPTLAWPALLAVALLFLLFLGFVAISLARGKRPSCNCFGQLQSTPIGPTTLLRNAALALATLPPLALGSEAWGGGLLPLVALSLQSASGLHGLALGLLLAVLAQAWVNLQLVSQQGRLILQIDNLEHRISGAGLAAEAGPRIAAAPALPLGSAVPAFASRTLAGQSVTDRWLKARGAQLLLFVGADCAPCLDLARELMASRRNQGDAALPALSVFGHGSESAVRGVLAPLLGDDIVLQQQHELNEAFAVVATPSALWLDAQGRIASAVAVGHDAVLALARAHSPGVAQSVPSSGLAVEVR